MKLKHAVPSAKAAAMTLLRRHLKLALLAKCLQQRQNLWRQTQCSLAETRGCQRRRPALAGGWRRKYREIGLASMQPAPAASAICGISPAG